MKPAKKTHVVKGSFKDRWGDTNSFEFESEASAMGECLYVQSDVNSDRNKYPSSALLKTLKHWTAAAEGEGKSFILINPSVASHFEEPKAALEELGFHSLWEKDVDDLKESGIYQANQHHWRKILREVGPFDTQKAREAARFLEEAVGLLRKTEPRLSIKRVSEYIYRIFYRQCAVDAEIVQTESGIAFREIESGSLFPAGDSKEAKASLLLIAKGAYESKLESFKASPPRARFDSVFSGVKQTGRDALHALLMEKHGFDFLEDELTRTYPRFYQYESEGPLPCGDHVYFPFEGDVYILHGAEANRLPMAEAASAKKSFCEAIAEEERARIEALVLEETLTY